MWWISLESSDTWPKAKECERLATQARDPMVKATYRELVQQWRDLAEQIRELTR